MWIMTNYGILMPATIPTELAEDPAHPAFGYDLQIRSRDRATLQKCRARYMVEYVTSEIVSTPDLDYEFRFYCRRHAFADAVQKMVLEIDYEKFKPTTLRKGNGGKHLHMLYNEIWQVVFAAYWRRNRKGRK